MTTTVAVRTRAGSPTIWLEVSYEGLDAPTQLFADLELLGWTPPTPAPPPHDAIDWSTPNAATGERFTLRGYRIEGAVAQPPKGTGARGLWTDAERAAHLASLGRLLDRHPSIELDDEVGIVAAATPDGGAQAPPPPAPVAPAASYVPSPGARAVLITAPLKPSKAPEVEDALVALGVTAVFDNHQRVATQRYRGTSYDTTVTELHVAAVVPPDQLEVVAGTLSGFGLTLTYADVDDDAVAPDDVEASEPGPAPEVVPGAASVERSLARVVALVDPRAADAVAGVIRDLGLVDTSLTAATRTEISKYRGSRSEREIPTLRVEVWVPEPHAKLVATHLADATHLRLGDLDRIWIDPPAPADGPDPAPADEVPRYPAAPPAPRPIPGPAFRPMSPVA